MSSSRSVLIMYIPALHQSYISFFKKYKDKVDTLYILGQDIIDKFPRMQREIRAIKPEVMKQLVRDYFPAVEIADERILSTLSDNADLTIIMSDELISDTIKEKYFRGHKVIQEPFFLRFDEKTVRSTRKEVEFTGTITRDEFSRTVINKLNVEKAKSSDWFLRVAAAVVLNDEIIAIDHNHRMPTPYSMWSLGDPRNYMEYGTDTHQRTTLHAEQAVIAYCAKTGLKLEGSDFYVNVFPCPDCAQLISQTGVKHLFFSEGYSALSSEENLRVRDIDIIKVI